MRRPAGTFLYPAQKRFGLPAGRAGVRFTAAACAALVLAGVLIFSLFTAAEAKHRCSGEDCPICAQITWIKNVLKVCAPNGAKRAFFLLLTAAAAGSCLLLSVRPHPTPVSRKVRLDD